MQGLYPAGKFFEQKIVPARRHSLHRQVAAFRLTTDVYDAWPELRGAYSPSLTLPLAPETQPQAAAELVEEAPRSGFGVFPLPQHGQLFLELFVHGNVYVSVEFDEVSKQHQGALYALDH